MRVFLQLALIQVLVLCVLQLEAEEANERVLDGSEAALESVVAVPAWLSS